MSTRPVEKIGAHAKGHNATSIGTCYEGRAGREGPSQGYPDGVAGTFDAGVGENVIETVSRSRVCGHRELSPDLNANGEIEPEEWIKQCPRLMCEDKKLH